MLVIIIYWIYVSIICISLGDAALHCFRKIFVVNQEKAVHPALRFITGLSIITFLGNAVSIFYRINIEFNVLIFLFSLIWIITHLKVYKTEINSWHRQLSSLNWLIWIAGFLFFLIAIIQASAPVDHHDEGGYYLPLVRWIEQYPVVPGSAWFLDRLGYNSAFHMSNAIFGEAFLFPGGFNDLGACLFIWVNWWFLTAFNRLLKKNYTFFYSDLLLSAALVVPFTFLNNTMDSDYPNLFIGIIILGLWIRKIESGNLWLIDLTVLLMLIFGLYLSTVRLFSVLLLLFPGFILLNESIKSKSKVLITAIVVGMIYLLPWLILLTYLIRTGNCRNHWLRPTMYTLPNSQNAWLTR